MNIPKIIHQIWIGTKTQPKMWTNTFSIDYVNKYPEWKYLLWTENNINELFDQFPIIKMIYDAEETYNGKSDILRYLILYKNGGIYIDADSVWINNKNFDDLINQVNETGIFLAYEPGNKNICGGVMGSTKYNKYVKLFIEGIENIIKEGNSSNIKKYIKMRKIKGVCKCIGPFYLDRTYKNFDKEITIFPSIYFYPVTWHGISEPDQHLRMNLPDESYTFQYGYTTNNFEKNIH